MADIRLEGVTKAYGSHRVHSDLNLAVNQGECFTLLGPSGCGKTVMLRLIAGFEAPDAGRVAIGGTVVYDAGGGVNIPPDRRGLGVVFQDYAVWPHMTVFQNVAYPLKIAGWNPEELKRRTLETIALVNMKGLENRLPSELSGGQQQRVALARALAARPSLMLLDEPLSNLDANLREEMRFEIKEIQGKLGVTVLYVTHDQEVALVISDRMAVMDGRGRIRQIGSPAEIYENPADAFVFGFMGVANFLPTRSDGGKLLAGGGAQPIPWPGPEGKAEAWTAAFRPSDIVISRPKPLPGAGCLSGVIRRASFLGAMMDYLIDVDGAKIRAVLETHEAMSRGLIFKEGESCAVTFLNLHWFDSGALKETAI
ncbi:MAG: ABC transporter ATP-binding protein [Planctomycetota bacterium]|jgi:iron(III) transport system ATP-binding protein|nr:ABC transporter ATP-binding protein [Planctomycetota bacterium]